jgi:glutathione S-transferase
MFYAHVSTPLSERGQAAALKLIDVTERLLEDRGSLFEHWSIADADLSFMIHRLILNGDPVPARVHAYATAQWQRPSVQAFVKQARPAKK